MEAKTKDDNMADEVKNEVNVEAENPAGEQGQSEAKVDENNGDSVIINKKEDTIVLEFKVNGYDINKQDKTVTIKPVCPPPSGGSRRRRTRKNNKRRRARKSRRV